jgi:3-hydroxyisobutyrate dehydrogenase
MGLGVARSLLRAGFRTHACDVRLASATVLPDYAEHLGQRLAERGILLIDAPLSGGAAKAAHGAMTMMTSGPAEAYAKCEDVLAAIATKVYRLGDRPGQGSKVKIINAQQPDNVSVGARMWIARIMITWGLLSACFVFIKTPVWLDRL